MIPEFNTFAGNKILQWLLMNPDSRFHINELARELGISPSTVLRYANVFQKAGIVTIEKIGTAHQIILRNEKPVVKELKKCAILFMLIEYGIEEIARDRTDRTEDSIDRTGEMSEETTGRKETNVVAETAESTYAVSGHKGFPGSPNILSVALYGSAASGTFNDKSDLDILIIGEADQVDKDKILSIQEKIGKPIQLTVIPWHRFERKKKEGDPFVKSVLENHILLFGAEL
ncbi:MarR family transcriptional regulator [Methanocalculus taiwanensis]|uniref:MarR family transcriptional regulator n=1 Tax=Methanocalculus taiwanensis TaxID=106207 RepID=A0ABD4TFT4_9EURY|nr:nucleotidyltransferase domain-containing protein [Methanocalculus taiwanensis]MCQ1537829.1 MarR family transcriptional regulator [Methanocalculus taiwanensis]